MLKGLLFMIFLERKGGDTRQPKHLNMTISYINNEVEQLRLGYLELYFLGKLEIGKLEIGKLGNWKIGKWV